jgi:hypothetical protein
MPRSTAHRKISAHPAADGMANSLCFEHRLTSVLDYGCGKGCFIAALPPGRRYTIEEYDPAIPGKDSLPQSVDLVVCDLLYA